MNEAPIPDTTLTSASKCAALSQMLYKPSTEPAYSLITGLSLYGSLLPPTVQMRTLRLRQANWPNITQLIDGELGCENSGLFCSQVHSLPP